MLLISDSNREKLSKVRHRIRVPIHQVISYAEIIIEETSESGTEKLRENLASVTSGCEAALQLTNSLPGKGESFESFLANLPEQLMECAANIEESCRAASDALAGGTETLVTDIHKLSAAAEALQHAVRDPGLLTGVAAGSQTAPGAEVHQSNNALSPPRGPALAQRGLVLVVDDDEANRDVLSRRLLRDGLEVMVAESGRQALRMLKRYRFDLVLLDITMPEMDGYAVLSAVKSSPELRHLPVMMITAIDDLDSVVRCIELGAEDYLLKPFNAVLLKARVTALLDRKRFHDEETRKQEELNRVLKEVEEQRTKAERLLLNILPEIVARELQENGSVTPMYFEDVTIIFADIAGFTSSTEHLPADELVGLLHEYFTAFDRIMFKYRLEKLKTIGDCYMFGGGLPSRNSSHPVDSVLAALEMVRTVEQMAEAGPVNWKMRVGVHTGPVIAGVVGIHKFVFDVWGDTVNFASRMESNGVPNRVNVSLNTYARVKDFFSCEKRAVIQIKEGRDVQMYLVNGVAAGLLGSKTCTPMKAFESRYQSYFRKDLDAFPGFLAPAESIVAH